MKENYESLMAKPRMDINCTESFVPYEGEGHPSVRLVMARMLFPQETAVILGERAKRTFEAIDGHLTNPTISGDDCVDVVRELVKFYQKGKNDQRI